MRVYIGTDACFTYWPVPSRFTYSPVPSRFTYSPVPSRFKTGKWLAGAYNVDFETLEAYNDSGGVRQWVAPYNL